MKKTKQLLFLCCCLIVALSCNSNALKQENAEKAIREFLSKHGTQTAKLEVSPAAIQEIGKTNIYSQFYTSVRVRFNSQDRQLFTLLFDFKRTPDNKWFLKKVEGVDGPIQELKDWLEANKKLNIQVQ